MLTDEEVKILDARYPGKEGRSASEVQADAFADWVKNEKRPVPRSAKSIFEKISQFFERLSNFLEGLGFKTAEDIFEAASEGRIRERYEATGREGAPETAFKMEPVEQAEVKEALAHPEASVMEAVQEKQHLKSLIRAEIEGEEIPEGSAVRFADAGYIKSVLRQGRLPEGGSFEGRSGISATRVKRGITPVAYGSNYKHSAAIAIPKEYIRGTGNAPNEVLIDPKVPLDRLRFYIDGQERSFTHRRAAGGRGIPRRENPGLQTRRSDPQHHRFPEIPRSSGQGRAGQRIQGFHQKEPPGTRQGHGQ